MHRKVVSSIVVAAFFIQSCFAQLPVVERDPFSFADEKKKVVPKEIMQSNINEPKKKNKKSLQKQWKIVSEDEQQCVLQNAEGQVRTITLQAGNDEKTEKIKPFNLEKAEGLGG